jgi:hypothetical protein
MNKLAIRHVSLAFRILASVMHNERCSRQALEDAPEIAFRDVPWTTKTR